MSISDPAGDVNGSFIANTSAKVGRWREHIEHHLKFDTQHITPLLSSPAKFLPPPTYAVPCDSPSGRKTTDAIQKVRNNKAPGEDGVPDEICRSCVDTLAPSLHEKPSFRVVVERNRQFLGEVAEPNSRDEPVPRPSWILPPRLGPFSTRSLLAEWKLTKVVAGVDARDADCVKFSPYDDDDDEEEEEEEEEVEEALRPGSAGYRRLTWGPRL
ncbi:hypothetical protein SprV_1002802200 [Sparganum proliferum]